MNNTIKKLKIILLPFLLATICFTPICLLLRYLVDFQHHLLPIKAIYFHLWLPMLFASLTVFFLLRKRIEILRFKNDGFHYLIFMAGAIGLPSIFSQHYLEQYAFTLQPIQQVEEIANMPHEKFFQIADYRVDIAANVRFATSEVTGRYGSNLNYHLYIASPFEQQTKIWYGIEYRESVDNRASKGVKEMAYKQLISRSNNQFAHHRFQDALYFEKMVHSGDRVAYIEAIQQKYPWSNAAGQVVLLPHFEPFEERFGNIMWWWIVSWIGTTLFIFLLVLLKRLDEYGYRVYLAEQK